MIWSSTSLGQQGYLQRMTIEHRRFRQRCALLQGDMVYCAEITIPVKGYTRACILTHPQRQLQCLQPLSERRYTGVLDGQYSICVAGKSERSAAASWQAMSVGQALFIANLQLPTSHHYSIVLLPPCNLR
eukprot:GHUV01033939.1.p1 GENE.GHUV01033939.1~~GHUV01033939.1.p1  ORF type:complete len:130 (+),score=14.78 GHUV01033939.1:641-1030(+)